MLRLRFSEWLNSRGPAAVGLCTNDLAGNAAVVNASQERLITCKEAGDAGWWGSYAEIAYNVSRSNPYITLARDIARIEWATACTWPVPVVNGFFEYLNFGDGNWPKNTCPANRCEPSRWYARNPVPLFTDITEGDLIRVYSSQADDGKRVLIGGLDGNNQIVTNLDGTRLVQGEFVTLQSPFVDTVNTWNKVTGVQKDQSIDLVSLYGVNPTTAAQTLLLTMQPSEKTAWYRRYYMGGLPKNCCTPIGGSSDTAQIKIMAKMDLVPVSAATDYLLIQSLEALIAEAQSIRFGDIDGVQSKVESTERHKAAVRFLIGQGTHYNGKNEPALEFRPFGSARLEYQRIGSML